MLIKICGICNSIDAKKTIKIYEKISSENNLSIGFVMGGKILPSEIEMQAQHARKIIESFPGFVDSVVVTHLDKAEDILSLSDYVRSTSIQVSEPISVSQMRTLRENTNKKIIKTIEVQGDNSFEQLKLYEPFADFFLLDRSVAGYIGGTGVTSDWNLCRKLVEISKKPVYLAGGLTPDNIKDAINIVKPDGVDVSTGVGTYSNEYLKKDRKCSVKIQHFFDRVINV
jgi:phosphoribosylanthranilate isomerase